MLVSLSLHSMRIIGLLTLLSYLRCWGYDWVEHCQRDFLREGKNTGAVTTFYCAEMAFGKVTPDIGKYS